MKSIEELARALVARRAEAAALRRDQKALLAACEAPHDWGDGIGPTTSCGYWDLKVVGTHCQSCSKALAMEPQRAMAAKAKRNAMTALTKAVKRDAR